MLSRSRAAAATAAATAAAARPALSRSLRMSAAMRNEAKPGDKPSPDAEESKDEAKPAYTPKERKDSQFVLDRDIYTMEMHLARLKYLSEVRQNNLVSPRKLKKMQAEAARQAKAQPVALTEEQLMEQQRSLAERIKKHDAWQRERAALRLSGTSFEAAQQQNLEKLKAAMQRVNENSAEYLTSTNDEDILKYLSARIGEGFSRPVLPPAARLKEPAGEDKQEEGDSSSDSDSDSDSSSEEEDEGKGAGNGGSAGDEHKGEAQAAAPKEGAAKA